MMEDYGTNSTSDLLRAIEKAHNADNINVGDLLRSLSENGFALVNLICAIILMIPTPPPTAIVMGFAIMFFSWQMFTGRKSIWMPKYITTKSIPRHVLALAVEKSAYYLYKMERLTHRRMFFMLGEKAKRISGFIMFTCAAISLSPLLFANTIPGAAIVLICFGILNKDGFAILTGYVVAIIGAAVAWYMVMFGAVMFFKLWDRIFK